MISYCVYNICIHVERWTIFLLQTEKEADNYGLYLPSSHGRPGKFLDEERLLTDYALQGHVPQLEFRYRCRDFMSVPGMTEKQIVKANTKVR